MNPLCLIPQIQSPRKFFQLNLQNISRISPGLATPTAPTLVWLPSPPLWPPSFHPHPPYAASFTEGAVDTQARPHPSPAQNFPQLLFCQGKSQSPHTVHVAICDPWTLLPLDLVPSCFAHSCVFSHRLPCSSSNIPGASYLRDERKIII